MANEQVVVPRVATLEMKNAGWQEIQRQGIEPEDVEMQTLWAAMVDAVQTGDCESKAVESAKVGVEGLPLYLIMFDDTERPIETMFGSDIARKRYALISQSWNAHLFVKIDSNSRDTMHAKANAEVVPPAESAERAALRARVAELERVLRDVRHYNTLSKGWQDRIDAALNPPAEEGKS